MVKLKSSGRILKELLLVLGEKLEENLQEWMCWWTENMGQRRLLLSRYLNNKMN